MSTATPVRVSACSLCGRGYRVPPELDCYDCAARVMAEELALGSSTNAADSRGFYDRVGSGAGEASPCEVDGAEAPSLTLASVAACGVEAASGTGGDFNKDGA